jgi:heat-inducible transcriptional repressor
MIAQEQLTQRQKDILRTIVQSFIEKAIPVASLHLAKHFFVDLSPATIRNVMAELEMRGYLDHPHTSAGRIPTDRGYREYVNNLMHPSKLSNAEKSAIEQHVASTIETEEILLLTSKILSNISHQLTIVSGPYTSTGVLDKIELVPLSTTRVLVVLTMKSGLVKTITMEVAAEIPREKLDHVCHLLNQRIAGLTLKEIRETFTERIKDLQDEETGLIRLFIYSSQKLFDEVRDHGKLYISGTRKILDQPEFENPDQVRSIIEVLENEELVVHILEQYPADEVTVTIGSEHKEKNLEQYSLVVSTYHIGDVSGSIGLIGPKRMNYAKAVPLVEFTAQTISNTLS